VEPFYHFDAALARSLSHALVICLGVRMQSLGQFHVAISNSAIHCCTGAALGTIQKQPLQRGQLFLAKRSWSHV
jgi:hypothetical protein